MYDLIVIGSGPGGYTGAIRAAQLGLKTLVVEKHKNLGGVCLNVGCIPSKALLDSSEHYHFTKKDLALHGVKVSCVSLDLLQMMNRKKIVKELTSGIRYLFKKNKIDCLEGTASFVSPHKVKISSFSGEKVIEAKYIMLATGSKPRKFSEASFDGKNIISSTDALELDEVPKKLLVVGGGYIGLELGSVWSRLGSEVHVLEYADRLCPMMDKEISRQLLKLLQGQGLRFHLNSSVNSIKKKSFGVELIYQNNAGKEQTLRGDKALVSIGRRPYADLLGLENVGIQLDEKGFVPVDATRRTKEHKHIFAIGDLIGGMMLAHKAEEEGVAVAEWIAKGNAHVNYSAIPSVIYTWPEVASVGKTEDELKAEGVEYHSGVFPFLASGRAKALACTQGFVKILALAKTDRILGVHIIGPRASDMIAEAVMAMEMGASSEDIARTIHAHPTLSEVMREAALAVDKRARQI